MSEEKEKSFMESLFDKADSFLGGIERAIVPKEGLWQVDEVYDSEAPEGKQTTFVVSDGKSRVECWDKLLAKRVADGLNG